MQSKLATIDGHALSVTQASAPQPLDGAQGRQKQDRWVERHIFRDRLIPGELEYGTMLDSVRLQHWKDCCNLELTYILIPPLRAGATAANDSNVSCSQHACVSSSHTVCTLQLASSLVLCKAAIHMCVRIPLVNYSSVSTQLANKLAGSCSCTGDAVHGPHRLFYYSSLLKSSYFPVQKLRKCPILILDGSSQIQVL